MEEWRWEAGEGELFGVCWRRLGRIIVVGDGVEKVWLRMEFWKGEFEDGWFVGD